jgi:two-component system phosphate regulon sensor histidine kinase PhoR
LLSIVNFVTQLLKSQATKKNITVSVSGETAYIFAVKQMIEELIYNLCENAIKYNKPNGKLMINVYLSSNYALLIVEDTGIGIPKEHHNRIFERFYRVDKSHSKQTGGTGLGLSIVKHIAEYHDATIKLDSNENTGTKITVAFPTF